MTEDEAFEILEQDIRRKEYQDILKRAQIEAPGSRRGTRHHDPA